MKVTLLTAHLSPRRAAGVWTALLALGGHLRAAGVDCRILGLAGPGETLPALPPGACPLAACRGFGPAAFGWAPGLAPALTGSAPDLVHAQGLWMYPSWASLRWGRRSRRPWLVSPHGMLDPWALGRAASKKRLALGLFEQAHLEGAACLHATSAMEAAHLRRFGLRQPIAVIPNGIDLPPSAPAAPERPVRRLLFLSRIHPKKGIDLLLQAWRRLAQHHPGWELVIAGPDESGHLARMQALALELGLARVRWPGPAWGEAKAALLEGTDLFVLPTHSENFGIVVAEALGHGLPVVTTRGTPWQGLVTERCGWWIELSPEALAAALDEAMRLPAVERRAMGRRGRAWMERAFRWPGIAAEMRAVYTWVLGGGPPPSCVMTD